MLNVNLIKLFLILKRCKIILNFSLNSLDGTELRDAKKQLLTNLNIYTDNFISKNVLKEKKNIFHLMLFTFHALAKKITVFENTQKKWFVGSFYTHPLTQKSWFAKISHKRILRKSAKLIFLILT